MNPFFQELGLEHYSEVQLKHAKKAHEVWKSFLKSEVANPGEYEQHFLTFDRVVDYHGFELPSNINRYILRSVDMDVVSLGAEECFVFTKICRFVLIGFIKIQRKSDWKGTRLSVNRGSLYRAKYQWPMWFNDYFVGQAKRAQEIQRGISNRQHDKIGQAYKENIEKFATSEMRTALDQDVHFFGRDAFNEPDEEE